MRCSTSVIENGKNDEYILTFALSISYSLPSEQIHLSSQQHNATTNFKFPPISKDVHISKIPQSASHPHPPSHHHNPAHHNYPATIKPPNIPTLATLIFRFGNRYGNPTSARDESIQFAGQSDGGKRAPWAGRNAFVPATRLVNTGAMSASGVGGDATSMTSPSPSIPTTTTTSRTASQDKVAVLKNYQSWIDSQPRSDSEREVLQDMPWLCESCVLSFMAGKEKQYTSVTTAKDKGAATGLEGVFRGQQEVFEMPCGGSGCSRSARSRDHILM
ncbi:hypothetical protein D6D02_03155 [Aureobasidium pullulans]|uniref:Uncharacterized protein n=1 Tax=Aureobasidium pullulans TaxID=5580 RepID=A0A4S8ZDG2_AURPU|nr:hypothetical protein D6D20_02943 [Aureobasidium pullulans]THX02659.1 hypothetical protein D6D18_03948 [Aureobasidium pullulans]THY17554.1 hypothetical protein D6D02_03155 [Aureobasidium pullulans]THY27031.1 hypothetical protein D6D00_05193 [Aureobasidium pullulans]TIA04848.1 hypothetical protein D6C82_00552 [Aureobasidium pullulans]